MSSPWRKYSVFQCSRLNSHSYLIRWSKFCPLLAEPCPFLRYSKSMKMANSEDSRTTWDYDVKGMLEPMIHPHIFSTLWVRNSRQHGVIEPPVGFISLKHDEALLSVSECVELLVTVGEAEGPDLKLLVPGSTLKAISSAVYLSTSRKSFLSISRLEPAVKYHSMRLNGRSETNDTSALSVIH